MDLERNVSTGYNPTNRNLSPKNILYVIHYPNMIRNLTMINKEADVLGFLCLGDGDTILKTQLGNILDSGR